MIRDVYVKGAVIKRIIGHAVIEVNITVDLRVCSQTEYRPAPQHVSADRRVRSQANDETRVARERAAAPVRQRVQLQRAQRSVHIFKFLITK